MCETKYRLVSKILDEKIYTQNTSGLLDEINNLFNNLLNNMKNITNILENNIKKIKKNRIKYENSWKYYFDSTIDFCTTNPYTYLEKEDYMMLPVIWFGSYILVYLYRNWNNLL